MRYEDLLTLMSQKKIEKLIEHQITQYTDEPSSETGQITAGLVT